LNLADRSQLLAQKHSQRKRTIEKELSLPDGIGLYEFAYFFARALDEGAGVT
jgi:hypothetical protein